MSDSDPQVLLKKAPADGTSIGNQSLREALGWNEKRYDAARDALIEAGTLEKGRGRGGSVKRITAGITKPTKPVTAKPVTAKPVAAKAVKKVTDINDDAESDSAIPTPAAKAPK